MKKNWRKFPTKYDTNCRECRISVKKHNIVHGYVEADKNWYIICDECYKSFIKSEPKSFAGLRHNENGAIPVALILGQINESAEWAN